MKKIDQGIGKDDVMVYRLKAVVFDLFGTLTNFIDPETEMIKVFKIELLR